MTIQIPKFTRESRDCRVYDLARDIMVSVGSLPVLEITDAEDFRYLAEKALRAARVFEDCAEQQLPTLFER